MVSKEDLSREVWGRVKNILKIHNISQVNLEKLCKEQGYRVTQPEISRLNSGSGQVTLYQLVAISKALAVPIEQFLYPDAPSEKVQISGGAFVTDPDKREFEGYLGSYHVVFHSTDIYSDKFLFGELNFGKDDSSHTCRAEFELDTGQVDREKKAILKKYHGQLLISGLMGVGYCLLINEKLGEISSIEIRHRPFFVKDVECRIGLVLTVSSGEGKRPAVHRCFLSRERVTPKLLERVMPFLKLTAESRETLVNRTALEKLAKAVSLCQIDFNALIEKSKEEEYIRIDRALIQSAAPALSMYEAEEILAVFKNHNGVYNSYIDEAEDSRSYAVLKKYKTEEEDDGSKGKS